MARKLVLAGFLALLLLGAGGYGVFVAWPASYARRVLALNEDLRAGLPGVASISPEQLATVTEDEARRLFALQGEFLASIREKVRALRPAPPQYRQLQQDLTVGVAWLLDTQAERERQLAFVIGAKNLETLIKQQLRPPAGGGSVGQFLAATDTGFQTIRQAGDALLAGGIPRGPKHAEFATAWQEAKAGLETLLTALRARDPRESFSTASAAILAAPGALEAERAVEHFSQLLANVTGTSLGSILTATPGQETASPEIAAALARIGARVEEFRTRYSSRDGHSLP